MTNSPGDVHGVRQLVRVSIPYIVHDTLYDAIK